MYSEDSGDSLSLPRPKFNKKEDDLRKGTKRLKLGGRISGIIIDVTKKGITIDGYYKNLDKGRYSEDTMFACIREPVEIEWDELEKLRKMVHSTKKKKERDLKPYGIAPYKVDKPSKKHLESLPIVTINNKKYYIDAENRLRRPVDTPEKAYKY